ncbi:MAG: phospholipid carrier-dependent glycosyltransferase [Thermoanaerobaculia bacterium]
MSNVGITTESTNELSLRATLLLALAGQAFVILGSFGALNAWTIALGVIACVLAMKTFVWRWWYLAFAPMIALASYPPLAFDETLYHLPYIDAIARSGTIALRPDIRFDIFPLLHELLCLPAYEAFGATATHFVAVLEVMLLAALVMRWPRTKEAGYLAAAIVIGNPVLVYVGTITYVDAALTLFVVGGWRLMVGGSKAASVVADGFGSSEPQTANRQPPTDLLLAGFLLGTAASVKYHGFFFVAAALLFVKRHHLHYILGALAGILPMTLRIFVLTGHPLHPYFTDSEWATLGPSVETMTTKLMRFVRLFYDITFAREHVNSQPPYTPFFAIALIVAIFFAKRWKLGLVCAAYLGAFILAMPPDSRYLLPLVPLVAVPAAEYVSARFRTRALAVIAALPLLAYPAILMARYGPLPLTRESRRALQRERIPALRALEHAPSNERVHVCGAEELKAFGGDRLVGDHRGQFAFDKPGDAQWIVISKRNCPPAIRAQLAADAQRVYQDDAAELWKTKRVR